MDPTAWKRFTKARDGFRNQVDAWLARAPGLAKAQTELARALGEDDYSVQTPIVYNRALDDLSPDSSVKWIIVADNPGKREQEADKQRYLIGQSGKTTENFFRRELGVDIRTEAVIVNKTPVHTPKTAQLKLLLRNHPDLGPVLEESQRWMAALVPELQETLNAPVWVMGLSELGPRGVFAPWTQALTAAYRDRHDLFGSLYLYKHFSMGAFATDLARGRADGESLSSILRRIGQGNRRRVFGM